MPKKMMTESESAVYFWAFRYCLGRMTYAVNWYCETATAKIRQIGYINRIIGEKEFPAHKIYRVHNSHLPTAALRLWLEVNKPDTPDRADRKEEECGK